MARHLILRLDAPLMSFGAEMVDAYGVVRDFPARSAITGLIANALGWERHEAEAHDRLQARLVMGSARIAEGRRIRDFQTAQLGGGDRGWTTRGLAEGRAGGAATYQSPHIRYRDADADTRVIVALHLDPADEAPTLDHVAAAFDRPERPLFIGRKPFLPSGPINAGFHDSATIADALAAALGDEKMFIPSEKEPPSAARAQWPVGEGPEPRGPTVELTDERNWLTGVHAGLRRVVEGKIVALFPAGA
jgi:CRISPR system Cascade subunit CasD